MAAVPRALRAAGLLVLVAAVAAQVRRGRPISVARPFAPLPGCRSSLLAFFCEWGALARGDQRGGLAAGG